jgi:hypothetical protein
VIGEFGKDLLVQLKSMLDAIAEQAGPELSPNTMQFASRDTVLAEAHKVKHDYFYQLYEGLKAMRTSLGDVAKLEYVVQSCIFVFLF